MVKFSFSRIFPDLEIHDHNSRLKISREIPWPRKLRALTRNERHRYIESSRESSIRGYQVYWTPVIDEVLVCERERHNIHDPFAVVEGSLMAPGVRQMSY